VELDWMKAFCFEKEKKFVQEAIHTANVVM